MTQLIADVLKRDEEEKRLRRDVEEQFRIAEQFRLAGAFRDELLFAQGTRFAQDARYDARRELYDFVDTQADVMVAMQTMQQRVQEATAAWPTGLDVSQFAMPATAMATALDGAGYGASTAGVCPL